MTDALQKKIGDQPAKKKKVSDPPHEVARPPFTGQNVSLLQARRPQRALFKRLLAALRAE
jgi:hypothetical protein